MPALNQFVFTFRPCVSVQAALRTSFVRTPPPHQKCVRVYGGSLYTPPKESVASKNLHS